MWNFCNCVKILIVQCSNEAVKNSDAGSRPRIEPVTFVTTFYHLSAKAKLKMVVLLSTMTFQNKKHYLTQLNIFSNEFEIFSFPAVV